MAQATSSVWSTSEDWWEGLEGGALVARAAVVDHRAVRLHLIELAGLDGHGAESEAPERGQHRLGRCPLEGDSVDGLEKGVPLERPGCLQDFDYLLHRQRPLELLAVEKLLLDLLETLLATRLGECLRAPPVPPAVASDDEVSDAARFEERRIHYPGVVRLDELLHFHEADADDGGLGVITEAHPVREPRPERHHVLQRAAHLHPGHVLDNRDVEKRVVENSLQKLAVLFHSVSDGGFAESAPRHLLREVGAHQHRHVHPAQSLLDHRRYQHHPRRVEVHRLDQRDCDAPRVGVSEDLLAEPPQELMRQHEYQNVRFLRRRDHAWVSHHVVRELDAWHVLGVLVLGVDDLCQLLAIYHLFEHPHPHLIVEAGEASAVFAHNFRDRCAPVS
mmetsp:Transcript_22266/g.53410  ORF Transcript_22266/g.53410 Transcript_22266/m.53410 type:complete len:390 (+) Transcript_22266:347-1516(+)